MPCSPEHLTILDRLNKTGESRLKNANHLHVTAGRGQAE
jgi:hypothetical protein